MSTAQDAALAEMTPVVSALLRALRVLEFVGRHLEPEHLPALLAAVGTPDETLRGALAGFDPTTESLAECSAHIRRAAEPTLAAFDGLRAAATAMDVRAAYRALRRESLALEALYPLARQLAPVDAFFLEPDSHAAAASHAGQSTPAAHTGIIHSGNEAGERGGFSLYGPENYRPEKTYPLVMALHGGSGYGRNFLWNWLRIARSRGLIVACPTATESTWALAGPDLDTPNLTRVVDLVRGRWNIDPRRLLLSGMSDGGSFALLSGLRADSPFTHLAPFAAGFHPLMAELADRYRARRLPVYLVHGVRDWMFPVELAQTAQRMLSHIGALVTYREVDDLAHVYPRDENAALVAWLLAN